MKKLGPVLGIISGIIIILSGILTALKITPPIALQGLEVALGSWRIFAGIVILFLVFISRKKPFVKLANIIIIFMGLFEIFVFYFEKDYSLLTIGPFIVILAGILVLIKK